MDIGVLLIGEPLEDEQNNCGSSHFSFSLFLCFIASLLPVRHAREVRWRDLAKIYDFGGLFSWRLYSKSLFPLILAPSRKSISIDRRGLL
jgi:hypothetical protein